MLLYISYKCIYHINTCIEWESLNFWVPGGLHMGICACMKGPCLRHSAGNKWWAAEESMSILPENIRDLIHIDYFFHFFSLPYSKTFAPVLTTITDLWISPVSLLVDRRMWQPNLHKFLGHSWSSILQIGSLEECYLKKYSKKFSLLENII